MDRSLDHDRVLLQTPRPVASTTTPGHTAVENNPDSKEHTTAAKYSTVIYSCIQMHEEVNSREYLQAVKIS